MKNIMEMVSNATSSLDLDFADSRELLYLLANDQIFSARERLLVLLNEPPSPENKQKLETEFREFYCGYERRHFKGENCPIFSVP